MYKQTIISILLILCALCVRAEDSIIVCATDLQALMQRVERLEQKAEQDSISQKVVPFVIFLSTFDKKLRFFLHISEKSSNFAAYFPLSIS